MASWIGIPPPTGQRVRTHDRDGPRVSLGQHPTQPRLAQPLVFLRIEVDRRLPVGHPHDVATLPHRGQANSLTPTAFAVTRDDRGWVLLVRRSGDGNWELPVGRVELGESAVAAVREVAEESGVDIAINGLAGVYSDPGHLMAYSDDGEIRPQFEVCLYATQLNGSPTPDQHETSDAAWIDPALLAGMPIHPAMRLRIDHALAVPTRAPLA